MTMCELCDDDRLTVVIAGEMPADEPDNAAMIARDLDMIRERLYKLPMQSTDWHNKRALIVAKLTSIGWELDTL